MSETEQVDDLQDSMVISAVMEILGTEAQGQAGVTYGQIIGPDPQAIVLVVS